MSEGIYTPPPPPPPPPPAPSASPAGAFDFAKPFTFVFEDPRWVPKILFGGLFVLLGFFIVGWFFLLGYFARFARNVVAGSFCRSATTDVVARKGAAPGPGMKSKVFETVSRPSVNE